MLHFFRDSKSQRASKLLYWLKRYGKFVELVNFSYWWSLSGGGFAINRTNKSSFMKMYEKKTLTNIHKWQHKALLCLKKTKTKNLHKQLCSCQWYWYYTTVNSTPYSTTPPMITLSNGWNPSGESIGFVPLQRMRTETARHCSVRRTTHSSGSVQRMAGNSFWDDRIQLCRSARLLGLHWCHSSLMWWRVNPFS